MTITYFLNVTVFSSYVIMYVKVSLLCGKSDLHVDITSSMTSRITYRERIYSASRTCLK